MVRPVSRLSKAMYEEGRDSGVAEQVSSMNTA